MRKPLKLAAQVWRTDLVYDKMKNHSAIELEHMVLLKLIIIKGNQKGLSKIKNMIYLNQTLLTNVMQARILRVNAICDLLEP